MDELPQDWCVTTQRQRRGEHNERWAYVIDQPGYFSFVSRHIFHTADAAQRAGEEDANLSARHESGAC